MSEHIAFRTKYEFSDSETELFQDLVRAGAKDGEDFGASPILEILDLRSIRERLGVAPIPFINYDVEFSTREVASQNLKSDQGVCLDGAYAGFYDREDPSKLAGMLTQEMENRHYTLVII